MLFHIAFTFHETVEHGHHDEGDECGDKQTTDNDDTHRGPHLGALAGGGGHRYHAEDCGECGHHNRPHTRLARYGDGLVQLVTTFAHKVDIVNKHDTVLHHDTDKQDDTQRTDHVEVSACYQQREDDAGEGKRDGHHDDERF